jgi:hypothetical protein
MNGEDFFFYKHAGSVSSPRPARLKADAQPTKLRSLLINIIFLVKQSSSHFLSQNFKKIVSFSINMGILRELQDGTRTDTTLAGVCRVRNRYFSKILALITDYMAYEEGTRVQERSHDFWFIVIYFCLDPNCP